MATEKNAKGGKLKFLILSVVIAIIAWTVVTYSTDPDMTRTISGVKVELSGTDQLQERGLVVLDADRLPKMSVKVTGKRSDLMTIMDDIRVVLELSSINSAGTYEVKGSVKLPTSRVTVDKIISDGINLTVDKLETRDVNILIYQDGEVSGKIVETKPKSETVAITGATSELDLIDGAYATIDLGGVTEEGTVKLDVSIAPKSGVNLENLTTLVLKTREIDVENIFYEPIEVPVYVTAKNIDGFDIDQTKTVVSPEKVTVGIKAGYTIPLITATVSEHVEHEIDAQLNDTDITYIPDNVKTVKVVPAWTEVVN